MRIHLVGCTVMKAMGIWKRQLHLLLPGRYLIGSDKFWEVVWQAGVNAVHALGVKGPVGCVKEPCPTGVSALQTKPALEVLH